MTQNNAQSTSEPTISENDLIAQRHAKLKQIQDNISISITLTYIITGLLYTVLFHAIAYIGLMEMTYSLFMGISTYILGLVITIINIIFINFLHKKKVIKWEM